jgi:two-component system, sensor histidine kinase and response regulator
MTPDAPPSGRSAVSAQSGNTLEAAGLHPLLSAAIFESMLDSVEQSVIATDADGLICYWNAHAERLYGWRSGEVMGRSILEVTPAEMSRTRAAEIMDTLLSGARFRGEFEVRRRDGTPFRATVVNRPLLDEDGRLIGVVGVSWEERSGADASADMMAIMSHELRTPLTAIIGYQELLEGGFAGPLTEQQRSHLRSIRTGAWHLLDLVDQMLNLSLLDAGKEELRAERAHVTPLLREVAGMMTQAAESKGLMLELRPCCDDVTIVTDTGKLRQVLINLLNNAVKFTPAGTITLSAAECAPGGVTIRVSDTGIGFDPAQTAAIFEPFVQLNRSTTRETGGVGLGLALVARMVRLLGARIEVKSMPGSGSTFSVTLPPAPH